MLKCNNIKRLQIRSHFNRFWYQEKRNVQKNNSLKGRPDQTSSILRFLEAPLLRKREKDQALFRVSLSGDADTKEEVILPLEICTCYQDLGLEVAAKSWDFCSRCLRLRASKCRSRELPRLHFCKRREA